MATKYKDFTGDHAMALLAMREDIGRGNINEVSVQCCFSLTGVQRELQTSCIVREYFSLFRRGPLPKAVDMIY